MNPLLCALLILLPSLALGQAFPNSSPSQPSSGSITVIPVAPNVTVYQGSNGSSTTVIQTAPNISSYASKDQYGREAGSGIIVLPYAPSGPSLTPPTQSCSGLPCW